MISDTLPLFQYPTTTVWVDDDEFFLRIIKPAPCEEKLQKTFLYPRACIAYLKDYVGFLSQIPFLQKERNHENYDLLKNSFVNFDVTNIAKLRDYGEKSKEISVIVSDYDMPEINGLELFSRLQRLPIKKILLTGKAHDNDAVKAFNQGIIDCFIRKDNPNFVIELDFYIKDLQRQFFTEQSKMILTHLEVDRELPLTDEYFVTFFDAWCKKNKITEFYLIDKQGSFLTVNERQDIHYFVLHTEHSLNQFVELYTDIEEVKPLIEAVKQRRQVPFFGHGKEAWQFDISEWENHFYMPHILDGREKYYWMEL